METGGILQIGVNLTIKESQINKSDATICLCLLFTYLLSFELKLAHNSQNPRKKHWETHLAKRFGCNKSLYGTRNCIHQRLPSKPPFCDHFCFLIRQGNFEARKLILHQAIEDWNRHGCGFGLRRNGDDGEAIRPRGVMSAEQPPSKRLMPPVQCGFVYRWKKFWLPPGQKRLFHCYCCLHCRRYEVVATNLEAAEAAAGDGACK